MCTSQLLPITPKFYQMCIIYTDKYSHQKLLEKEKMIGGVVWDITKHKQICKSQANLQITSKSTNHKAQISKRFHFFFSISRTSTWNVTYCYRRNFQNFVLYRSRTFIRSKFSYSEGGVLYFCMRTWFAYSTTFRTFSQKYEIYKIKSRTIENFCDYSTHVTVPGIVSFFGKSSFLLYMCLIPGRAVGAVKQKSLHLCNAPINCMPQGTPSPWRWWGFDQGGGGGGVKCIPNPHPGTDEVVKQPHPCTRGDHSADWRRSMCPTP